MEGVSLLSGILLAHIPPDLVACGEVLRLSDMLLAKSPLDDRKQRENRAVKLFSCKENMMRRILLCGMLAPCILALVPAIYAQEPAVEPKTDDPFDQPVSEEGGASKEEDAFPLLEGLSEQLSVMLVKVVDTYLDHLARPETTEKLATFQKNYYDALVRKGFTEAQAFQLVRDFGNPLDGLSTHHGN